MQYLDSTMRSTQTSVDSLVHRLNTEFANDRLHFDVGRGGFPVAVMLNKDGAEAQLSFYGGHLLSWTHPTHGEVLYLSEKAIFESGKAIRGGVPVIFPWFGKNPEKATAHGVARTSMWEFVSSDVSNEATTVTVALVTQGMLDPNREGYFRLQLAYTLSDSLSTEIRVTNHSTSGADYQFALHTYFSVEEISEVKVLGLHDVKFVDTTKADRPTLVQRDEAVTFPGEVDSIYMNTPENQRIFTGKGYDITVLSDLPDRVVWNPGDRVAAGLADVPVGGHHQFVCVEAGSVVTPIRLDPNETFRARQEIRIS